MAEIISEHLRKDPETLEYINVPRPTCATCRFMEVGDCKRHAPTIAPNPRLPYENKNAFPRIRPNIDWCGDHEENPRRATDTGKPKADINFPLVPGLPNDGPIDRLIFQIGIKRAAKLDDAILKHWIDHRECRAQGLDLIENKVYQCIKCGDNLYTIRDLEI